MKTGLKTLKDDTFKLAAPMYKYLTDVVLNAEDAVEFNTPKFAVLPYSAVEKLIADLNFVKVVLTKMKLKFVIVDNKSHLQNSDIYDCDVIIYKT
jgi:hypothetical protein